MLAEKARALPPGTTIKEVPVRREWSLRRRFGPEVIADLVARYNAGASISALGREVGTGYQPLRQLLLEEGITLRHIRRDPLTPKEVKRAVQRYESGRTIRQVATELGSSYTTIRMLLHDQGVKMREDAFGKEDASEG